MTYGAAIRHSGYRINQLPPDKQVFANKKNMENLKILFPFIKQALAEPFYADDYMKDADPEKLLASLMPTSELFQCVHDHPTEGRVLVGIAILKGIVPNREAYFDAWTHPAFRGKYPCSRLLQDIFDYAFRPWNPERTDEEKKQPRGLGLMKIKCQTSAANRPAIRALQRLGFKQVGLSPCDGLFQGQWTDVILVEKPNPGIFDAIPPEELEHGKRSETPSSADVRSTPAVHSAPSVRNSEPDNPERGDSATDNPDGESDRGEREFFGDPEISSIERKQSKLTELRQSIRPRGANSISTELLSAIRESRSR